MTIRLSKRRIPEFQGKSLDMCPADETQTNPGADRGVEAAHDHGIHSQDGVVFAFEGHDVEKFRFSQKQMICLNPRRSQDWKHPLLAIFSKTVFQNTWFHIHVE